MTNLHPRARYTLSGYFSGLRAAAFSSSFQIAVASAAFFFVAAPAIRAQSSHEFVGRIQGHDFVVENNLGTPVPAGDLADLLSSGNRLVVHSGQARILLEGGGDILICGAAELQVLKSQGALTIALDYGTVRVHVKGAEPVSIFSPLVVATTVAIGDGERDLTIGLEKDGKLCLRAISGAVRVAQQLSGESLLVPQFGGLTLSGGQLNAVSATAAGCTCALDLARLSPLHPSTPQQIISAAATRSDSVPTFTRGPQIASPLPQSPSSNAVNTPPSINEPVFTVIMPPLVFDASNPEPPAEPDMGTAILVRSVRVKEDTVVRGSVVQKGSRPTDPASVAAKTLANNSEPHPGVFARIGGFFRRLFGGAS